jgi:hypothetical protein
MKPLKLYHFVDRQVHPTEYFLPVPFNLTPPFWGGAEPSLILLRLLNGLLYQPRIVMSVEHSVERLDGETEIPGRTCPSAALCTTNPT